MTNIQDTINSKQRVNSHPQLMHAFPGLGDFKTFLEVALNPLGMLDDIARTEKGEKGEALWNWRINWEKEIVLCKHFVGDRGIC